MNTISSLFKWIGDLIGANPNTLTTTSKTLIGAINEVDGDVSGKVSKSGDTMTGNLEVARSDASNVNVSVKNSVGYVTLHSNPAGNHGVYSITKSKWIAYCDTSGNVYVNDVKFPNADYVVEQGTSGIWTYRKWNSGIAECWATISAGSVAMTTAEGSAYYAPVTPYSYPSSLFTGYPSTTCSAEMNGALGGFAISANSASRVQGYWWATKSVTKNCYLYVYAIGRWK